jgi:hypothetical protein
MNAAEIVDEARDLHPAFDDNSHPDKIVVRFLSRFQLALISDALTRYPSLWSTTQDEPMPLADHAAGIALTAPLFVYDVVVLKGDRELPVVVIPYEHRHDPRPDRSAWIVNRRLYLDGKASAWAGSDAIRIRYATTPTALTSEDSVLILPDTAREALVTSAAAFMAGRGSQRRDIEAPNYRQFAANAEVERERFLKNLWLLRSADARFIRDVRD